MFLLIVGLIVFAFIFLYIFFCSKCKKVEYNETVGKDYGLSLLEKSILKDLVVQHPQATQNRLLYLLCCRPIRPDKKLELAQYILGTFPRNSVEHNSLKNFIERETHRQETINQIDDIYREYERTKYVAARAPPPPPRALPQSRYPHRQPPPPQYRQQPRQPPPLPPPQPLQAVINPFMLEQDFDIFNFIDAVEMNRQLREFANFENVRRVDKTHVYNSTQNVHSVNKSAIDVALKLIRKYRDKLSSGGEECKLLIRNAPLENVSKINAAVNTIVEVRVDEKYGYEETFTLKELFYCILAYIKDSSSERQTELLKRLYEELEAMSAKCGTGHLVRLVNVFQGFDENFELKMPVETEFYARFSILCQKEMAKLEDLDDVLLNPDNLTIFLRKNKSLFQAILAEEYKELLTPTEIKTELSKALNKYTRSEIF